MEPTENTPQENIEVSSDAQATSDLQAPQHVEHPQGEEIVKQVEYYFSDENLPNDAYLLDKIAGKENKPIEIKKICQFPKMRKYKPYRSVVESLKKSTMLEVIDNKYIERKVPLTIEHMAPEKIKAVLEEEQKKKGFNRPPPDQPWMTKAMMKPTGFEEFYADAPVTPAAFKEEQSLYDQDISFETRIETAIQRYRARRKFHQQTAQVFNKFMTYGGIEDHNPSPACVHAANSTDR